MAYSYGSKQRLNMTVTGGLAFKTNNMVPNVEEDILNSIKQLSSPEVRKRRY